MMRREDAAIRGGSCGKACCILRYPLQQRPAASPRRLCGTASPAAMESRGRSPAGLDCEFQGVPYRSIGAMARALGIGWSKARSFAEEVHRCEIEYAGKKYHSMTALAAAYHLTFTGCMYRLGHNIPLEAPSVRGASSRKPCTWEGVDYPSITAAAKALGITHSAMSERLMRRDRPKRPRRKPAHMPCEYNGQFYSTLAEAARSLGLSRDKARSIVKFYD